MRANAHVNIETESVRKQAKRQLVDPAGRPAGKLYAVVIPKGRTPDHWQLYCAYAKCAVRIPAKENRRARGSRTSRTDDEKHLAELGYKQELHRSWSGFSNFAISFSIISILAGCFTSFGLGWNNGGPAAIAWGWPLVSIFILIIGLCMSELVSAYPTSGGIYWWASQTRRTRRPASTPAG